MPKFRVKVQVIATAEYTVEVDAPTEARAIGNTVSRWRDLTPPDFQVDKIANSVAEADQLTYECEDCAKEITPEQYRRGQGCCAECDEKWTREERLYASGRL